MEPELLRDRYEALETAGKGGEGEVVRARDRLHDRQVALKLRPAGDETSRARLLTEARLLLSLSPHPGLPLVREDFFADGRYVIAMDWIEGTDLEQLLRRDGRPGLDPALALSYLEQAAAALKHMHGHDPPVVHGDVKPANLIVTPSGRVVLVDFGLSSMPADELLRAGTQGYAAPEVAAGERPTASADVYSFAATALALLTGQAPVGGPPSWGTIDPERVSALQRILGPNLAVDPRRRDASAQFVSARLRRWWGADLPRGTVTLLRADLALEPRAAEVAVDEVARAHRGHVVSPSDDGPLTAGFSSADDAVAAARELASGPEARVVLATGEDVPRNGRYSGEPAAATAGLLEAAEAGEVVVDDRTAVAIGDALPNDVALARTPDRQAWTVVAPGLSIPAWADACPYRGLVPFRPEDGGLYFGREDVVAAVLARVSSDGFMSVVGASGSGKSSLVRAGVVPVFSRADDGAVAVLTPGSEPVAALEHAVADRVPSLLVVDQLEELFTLCSDGAARTRFIDELLDLHERGVPVAITLRADFYGHCADHPRLAAALAGHQCLLGPMSGEGLLRAIEGPAEAAGLRLEPGLADTMLADVGREPGALPLLSHALYESWLRRDGRVLTRAGYDAAGGVKGAIARTAEELYAAATPGEQAAMRNMLLRLVEPGDATEDSARRAPLRELVPDGDDGVDATAVLEQLAEARLLVVGDGSAEIAHEALIREWPRLRSWVDEDREQLRALRQVTVAARSWDENGRDEADLYRGARLVAATELVGDRARLSTVERAFLEASVGAEEHELRAMQRRARRLRALLAVVAAALVVALLAGALALVQRGRVRHTAVVAQSGRLAAQSREVAATRPDLALLLALESGRLDDSIDSRGALLGALQHGSRIRVWLQGLGSNVNASAFSPNGRLLATMTSEGTTLWDTSSWRPTGRPLRAEPGGDGLGFSPDGRTLAIAGGEGHVELWDAATRRIVRRLTDPAAVPGQAAFSPVAFSPNGKVIAGGGLDANHVTLWDAGTGRVIGSPITPHGPGGVQSVSFSPDSKRIAVAAETGTVGIWEVATGRRIRELSVGEAEVEEAIYADNGRVLITSDDSGAVSFLDLGTGKPARTPLSVGDSPAIALALSPDERLLAATSFDGSVHVWDLRAGVAYGAPLRAGTSPASDVAFSPDGTELVSAHIGSAVVWSMTGERVIGKLLGGEAAVVTDAAFGPDGSWLVLGRLGGDAIVVDAATGRQRHRLPVGPVVSSVAARPDGQLVAVATIDGRVHLFDPRSGAAVGRPLGARGPVVWQVAFSPDGKLLAVAIDPNGIDGIGAQARDGEVQLWDADARRRVGRAIRPRAGSVFAVAFDREGKRLATGSFKGRLDVWDVETRERIGQSQRVTDDGFVGVAFDPSGKLVAGGLAAGPVRVSRISDGRPAFPPLTGHEGNVTGVSFDPNGAYLATSDLYGSTRLWDAATGLALGDALLSERPASLEPNLDLPALGLRNAFSPDGTLLATSGVDAHGMLWDVDPVVWRRRACAIAGRNLSREEWRLYLPTGAAYRRTCPQWPPG